MNSLSVAPTGSNSGSGRRIGRRSRLPLWAKSHSRPPQARANGWVFASVSAPQRAVRRWSTKVDDSLWSARRTSSDCGLPWMGAASLCTVTDCSPGG